MGRRRETTFLAAGRATLRLGDGFLPFHRASVGPPLKLPAQTINDGIGVSRKRCPASTIREVDIFPTVLLAGELLQHDSGGFVAAIVNDLFRDCRKPLKKTERTKQATI